MSERIVQHVAELETLAGDILSTLPQKNGAHILALSGELGAGKTAFVQSLAKRLGVREHVTSPTFVIMRVYGTAHETFSKLVHIDAYRVEDVREMEVLQIPELFGETGTIVCIEWPERIESLVPADALTCTFTINNDESRTVIWQR